MKRELRLVFSPHPAHEPAGWLIPGDDPAAWLHAVAQADLPLADAQLRLVPRSTHDRTPAAALLTGPGLDRRPVPQALAYGLVAGRLFLPTHARLDPAVSDAELAELLTTPTAIFHPGVGLVGFEPGDEWRAADLVSAPVPGDSSWSMPEPGAGVGSRLRAIQPLNPMTLEQLDEELGEGVGGKPLSDLPPADGEREPGAAGKVGKSVVGSVAGAVGWLASKAPATSGKPTWIDSLADWANARRYSPGRADQEQRNKEVNRLVEMLSKKSAEALAYAIPLSGLSQARGTGHSGNQLTRRGTGFSVGGMYAGGPADPWSIADRQRQRLSQLYRERAVQEAAAGRFRQAAYIYGTLLGDADAAARVLEEGGYFQEAAVLLRDKLRRPVAAARCLERGGLLADAAKLYLENDHWLEAAAIYDRLEQPDLARRWYRHAAEQHTENHRYIAAAKLYEQQLDDPDAALQTLSLGALPPTRDPACLTELFNFTARRGRHDDARNIIHILLADTPQTDAAGRLATNLAQAHAAYPDAGVRQQLHDATLQLAGKHLPGQHAVRLARPFTDALRKLAPGDRLLGRDTRRYLDTIKPAPTKPPRQTADARALIQRQHTLQLAEGHWHEAYSIGENILAVGQTDGHSSKLLVTRIRKQRTTERYTVSNLIDTVPEAYPYNVSTALRAIQRDYELAIHVHGRPAIKGHLFKHFDAAPRVFVTTPDFLPKHTLAMSGHAPRMLWALVGTLADESELVLNGYTDEGTLIQSIAVSFTQEAAAALALATGPPRIRLHARREEVVLTIGRVLLRFAQGALVGEEVLGQPVTHIAGASAFARSRYALLHPRGLTMVWNHAGNHNRLAAASDTDDPVAAFTHNAGLLVVADKSGVKASHTSGGELKPFAQTERTHPHPSAPASVVPLGRGDDFAVLHADGHLAWYTVTPPTGARY